MPEKSPEGKSCRHMVASLLQCPLPHPQHPSNILCWGRRDHAVMARSCFSPLDTDFSVSTPLCPGKKERLEGMFSISKSAVTKLNHFRSIRNKNKHEEKLSPLSSEISLWTFALCLKVSALSKQKQTKPTVEPQFEAQWIKRCKLASLGRGKLASWVWQQSLLPCALNADVLRGVIYSWQEA